jgi:hypothetical protein
VKASGFVVIRVNGGEAVSRRFEIDTDTVFMTMHYGPIHLTTAHPDHRALMDEILLALSDQHRLPERLPA